jgi:glutamate N-acetyltransferase/amino-acid N-acetyltransferase
MVEVKNSIEFVAGFKTAGVYAGLKKDGNLDFAVISSDQTCTAAGVFTTNHVKAAPVLVDMERLAHHASHIRAVVVNTKSANACTGQQGIDNALQTSRWAAETLGCDENEILVMSTGVIGTQLPMEKIRHGIDLAKAQSGNDWLATARAIMTTDTRPKLGSVNVTTSSGKHYHIAGMCKGAGMIAPNMATMLGLIITDVALSVEQAQTALQAASKQTFNRIVVDGDMSTNDTLVLLANGASGTALATSEDYAQFQETLNALCKKLAQDIVRDGEGVTKFITIRVSHAPDDEAARQIGNTIATSPLVKTAFFGNDANWGRIIAAAGRSGVMLKPECIKLWLAAGETETHAEDALLLFENGMPTQYSEAQATAIISQPSVSVLLDCGTQETGAATVWTCDLSHDYVSINGDYRS